MGEWSAHIIWSPIDGSHVRTAFHSGYASTRVRTYAMKLPLDAKGKLA